MVKNLKDLSEDKSQDLINSLHSHKKEIFSNLLGIVTTNV